MGSLIPNYRNASVLSRPGKRKHEHVRHRKHQDKQQLFQDKLWREHAVGLCDKGTVHTKCIDVCCSHQVCLCVCVCVCERVHFLFVMLAWQLS